MEQTEPCGHGTITDPQGRHMLAPVEEAAATRRCCPWGWLGDLDLPVYISASEQSLGPGNLEWRLQFPKESSKVGDTGEVRNF